MSVLPMLRMSALPVIGLSLATFAAAIRPAFAAGVAMVGAVVLARTIVVPESPAATLALSVVVGGGVYTAMLLLFARPALTDAMTLSSVNTTTPGQVPLPGRCLIAGMRVRVWATAGMDSVAGPWHDTILQATRHTAATSTIEADPDGKPARGIHAMATWARGRYADPLKIRKR